MYLTIQKLSQSIFLVMLFFFINPVVPSTQADNSLLPAKEQSGFQQPFQLFFPFINIDSTYSLSGQVIDSLGSPLPGIVVTLSNGQLAVSDNQGMYVFNNLPAGSYTYSPAGGGYVFSPLQRSATLPPDLSGKLFTGQATRPVSLNMGAYYHSQRTETSLKNACGPASLLMTLDYFGLNPGSLNQVILATSLPPAYGGFDPTCIFNPVCLSADVITSVAQNQYHLVADAHENWTFDGLYRSLAIGHPVIALATYELNPDLAGHFVVVYGADPVNHIVTYHDPYSGPSLSASWTRFYTSWIGPVDVYDPLHPSGHHAWGAAISK